MKTTTKNTHELQQGDRLAHHGMILTLNEIMVSQVHNPNDAGGEVRYTKATIENIDDIEKSDPFIWALAHDSRSGEVYWQVQGNRFATWCVTEDES